MGILVDWHDAKQTIILVAYIDPWSWDDFYPAMRRLDNLIHQCDQLPDGIIFDFSGSRSIPANAFSHFRQIIEHLENKGSRTRVITVDVQGMWRGILNVLMGMYPNIEKRSYLVGNLEEARALISQQTAKATR